MRLSERDIDIYVGVPGLSREGHLRAEDDLDEVDLCCFLAGLMSADLLAYCLQS